MEQSTNPLSVQKRQRLQELTRQLMQAWQTATDVDLRKFLPPKTDPLYVLALRELVKTDLHVRWEKKQGKPLESYIDRYPDLGPLDQLAPDVLLEEYRARMAFAHPPELTSYRERFPRQYAAFEQLARQETTQGELWETAPRSTNAEDGNGGAPPAGAPRAGGEVGGTRAGYVAAGAVPSDFLRAVNGYTLVKRIGQGSFAEVWQGIAPGGFPVAIKRILRPLEDQEAQREKEALERMKEIRHPFLLQTHSTFLEDNHLYVVMELADCTLRDRMKECQKAGKRQIPLPELLRYFHESAEVLDYMHSQHVLHRDIKPQNILILRSHAKVADFGLALLQQTQRALLTATGCGTPAYMAPEVWRGKVGPQSDQYGLAFAYAEQRLGRLPFEQRDIASLMQAHLSEAPNLKELPAAEQKVLLQALAKEPDKRFATCQDFALALENALRDQLPLSTPSLHLHAGEARLQGPGSLSGTLAPDGRLSPRAGSATVPLDGAPPVAWKGERRRPRLLLALVMAGLLGGLGWFASKELRSSVVLEALAPQTLRAGEVKTMRVQIRRHRFEQPVQLSWQDLPAGWQAPEATIPSGDNNIDVTLVVPPDAQPGPGQATLRATGQPGTQKIRVELNVEPLAYTLPAGWRKAAEATLQVVDGRAYYDKIDVVRGDIPVRFLLVPKTQKDEPDTFYIMEDKVWVALFRLFADEAARDKPVQNNAWEGIPSNKVADNPVMGVTASDADRCAAWLGGKLPLPIQWDKAAGRFEKARGAGPYQGPYNGKGIGLGRDTEQGPIPRGTGRLDVGPFGCRDMAGNGYEWLGKGPGKGLTDDPRVRTPLDRLGKEDEVYVRGKPFTETAPLQYSELNDDIIVPLVGLRSDSRVGFRVVLEP